MQTENLPNNSQNSVILDANQTKLYMYPGFLKENNFNPKGYY